MINIIEEALNFSDIEGIEIIAGCGRSYLFWKHHLLNYSIVQRNESVGSPQTIFKHVTLKIVGSNSKKFFFDLDDIKSVRLLKKIYEDNHDRNIY